MADEQLPLWPPPPPTMNVYKVLTGVLGGLVGVLLTILGWIAQNTHQAQRELEQRVTILERQVAVTFEQRAHFADDLAEIKVELREINGKLTRRTPNGF